MVMIIRIYNNGFAFVSDDKGEHDASVAMAEYFRKVAETKYTNCQYRHYSNGDQEYIYY